MYYYTYTNSMLIFINFKVNKRQQRNKYLFHIFSILYSYFNIKDHMQILTLKSKSFFV